MRDTNTTQNEVYAWPIFHSDRFYKAVFDYINTTEAWAYRILHASQADHTQSDECPVCGDRYAAFVSIGLWTAAAVIRRWEFLEAVLEESGRRFPEKTRPSFWRKRWGADLMTAVPDDRTLWCCGDCDRYEKEDTIVLIRESLGLTDEEAREWDRMYWKRNAWV